MEAHYAAVAPWLGVSLGPNQKIDYYRFGGADELTASPILGAAEERLEQPTIVEPIDPLEHGAAISTSLSLAAGCSAIFGARRTSR